MIDFPNAPAVNQVFGNYKWDGEKWLQVTVPAGTPVASDLLPYASGTASAVCVFDLCAATMFIPPRCRRWHGPGPQDRLAQRNCRTYRTDWAGGVGGRGSSTCH
jgi:hypothetical protein